MPCTALHLLRLPLALRSDRRIRASGSDLDLWMQLGPQKKERGMHLDRKSDTGHKKCTAHGSRDAKSEADEAERERHTRKRFIDRQRLMYIERQRQMQRKQQTSYVKQGIVQCKKSPGLK